MSNVESFTVLRFYLLFKSILALHSVELLSRSYICLNIVLGPRCDRTNEVSFVCGSPQIRYKLILPGAQPD